MNNVGRPKGVSRIKLDRRDRSLGNVITRARIDRELGLRDVATLVADRSGTEISLQFISNIEHGRAPMPMNLVSAFAYVLGIPVKKLAAAALESTKVYRDYQALVA